MGKRPDSGLKLAVLVILLFSLAYILVTVDLGITLPSSGPGGYLLGGIGFVLMLMTEILYSLRKRAKEAAHWGHMESWLQFHIVTGLLGPYLILLHTSWRFNGLAGAVTLLTLLMVTSGFIGRYLYTSVPRTANGVELNDRELESLIATNEIELQGWLVGNPALSSSLNESIVNSPRLPSPNTWSILFGRVFWEWAYHWKWWHVTRRLKDVNQDGIKKLERLIYRRRELRYQITYLLLLRRVTALWHSIHVPLGIALFTVAFIHIGASLYFVTLAR